MFEYLPSEHFRHATDSSATPSVIEYVPRPQRLHWSTDTMLETSEKKPEGQRRQSRDGSLAPVVGPYVPFGHGTHETLEGAPFTREKRPSVQAEQLGKAYTHVLSPGHRRLAVHVISSNSTGMVAAPSGRSSVPKRKKKKETETKKDVQNE